MPRESVRHAIRNRLLLGMAITVVLGVVMAGAVFFVAATAINRLEQRVATLDRMQDAQHALELSLLAQETYVFDFALSGRSQAIAEFHASTQASSLAYADLRGLAVEFPQLSGPVEAVNMASSSWREQWAEPFIRSVQRDGLTRGTQAVSTSEILFAPAERRMSELSSTLADLRSQSAAEAARAVPDLAAVVVPFSIALAILLALVGVWLVRSISAPLLRLNRTATALVAGEPVTFRAERDDEVGALADVLERLRQDVGTRYESARQEGAHASIFNQLAERTSFASDEAELVEAAMRAIRRLVPTPSGDILLANPSQNRLTVAVAWGENAPEAGSLVSLDRIDRCPGIRRAAAFVAEDLSDDLAVHCPAHPVAIGTVACVPMSALGKIVGVIHLEETQAGVFTPDVMRLVARVSESVGLAMANARLMKTMEGQAMSDGLTGLRNARFFEPYLEQELEQAQRDRAYTSVIMLDLDRFKDFNDTYGHPAGDEALRTFARVLGSCIRASDVAARYGGEEFVVALHHAGLEDARLVAEKIRAAVEQTVVEIGPGRYGRITASLGVASTETQVQEFKALVAMADAALYRAKESGRNRVEIAPRASDVTVLAEASRRRRGRVEPNQAASTSA